MRRGEIAALDIKNDIDYERGLISITKAYTQNTDGEFILKEPKTCCGKRVVVCPKWATERIKKYAEKYKYEMPNPTQIGGEYQRLRKKYNLCCSFHGLRHYFASVMLALDVPEKYAMERMGHSTNSMLKHYQESMQEKEIEINTAMSIYFDALNPNTTQKTTCEQIKNQK